MIFEERYGKKIEDMSDNEWKLVVISSINDINNQFEKLQKKLDDINGYKQQVNKHEIYFKILISCITLISIPIIIQIICFLLGVK